MTTHYEKIIEHILEAKDTGTSLASLLEKHPEQKGEYFDAWKFVESIDEQMHQEALPDKERFRALVGSISSSRPILSQWMPYATFAIPALVIVFMVFSYTSKDNGQNVALVVPAQETQEVDTSLFTTGETALFSSDTQPMAKSAGIESSSEENDSLENSFASIQNAYEKDSETESQSSITFADNSTYSDLSTIYE